MGNNDNHVTGNQAFDNVITSVQLLHEYINETNDETSFAFVIGGAMDSGTTMHCVATNVGNLHNPPVLNAAVETLVNTMKRNSLIASLITKAFLEFKTSGKVKVVKMSVDSPEEALFILKNILNNEHGISNLENITAELLKKIIDSLPTDFKRGFYEGEPCDDPDCAICAIRLKLRNNIDDNINFMDLFFPDNNKASDGN